LSCFALTGLPPQNRYRTQGGALRLSPRRSALGWSVVAFQAGRPHSPRKGLPQISKGRAERRQPRSAALGWAASRTPALKGRNKRRDGGRTMKRGRIELFRPYRATTAKSIPYPGRRSAAIAAALCGYRRGALPWAGLFWPFRPDGRIRPERGSHKSAQRQSGAASAAQRRPGLGRITNTSPERAKQEGVTGDVR